MIGNLFKESEVLRDLSVLADVLQGIGLVLVVVGGAVILSGLLTRRSKS